MKVIAVRSLNLTEERQAAGRHSSIGHGKIKSNYCAPVKIQSLDFWTE